MSSRTKKPPNVCLVCEFDNGRFGWLATDGVSDSMALSINRLGDKSSHRVGSVAAGSSVLPVPMI
jgi:hypothetical protein